jgi:serine protease inhibitor
LASGKPQASAARPRAAAINQLGFQLLERLGAGHPGRNLLLSPYSLALSLALAYNGAARQTREELARALGVEGVPLEEVNQRFGALRTALEQRGPQLELAIANGVWTDGGLRLSADFLQRIQECYAAEAQILAPGDPGAADRINQWVSSKTDGRIKALLSREELASSVGCVLTNAVYFKGLWSAPFDPGATCEMPFELPDGRLKNVSMMLRSGQFSYFETEELQAIELTYSGGLASMYILLPNERVVLDMSHWEGWLPQFQTSEVNLTLPRFSLTYEQDMKKPLSELGLALMFQPAADFSAMGLAGHYITGIKHKARIDVTEEGTEAAAGSAVLLGRSLRSPISMVVSRPFFCAIRDTDSGVLLFLGRIAAPE